MASKKPVTAEDIQKLSPRRKLQLTALVRANTCVDKPSLLHFATCDGENCARCKYVLNLDTWVPDLPIDRQLPGQTWLEWHGNGAGCVCCAAAGLKVFGFAPPAALIKERRLETVRKKCRPDSSSKLLSRPPFVAA